MPLRDPFHSPLKDQEDWKSFHSAWANTMVRRLNSRWLLRRYRSAPQVHLGALVEIDVAAFEQETPLAANLDVVAGEQSVGAARTGSDLRGDVPSAADPLS